jgi:lycopene cyclase domain-containing protein
MFGHTTYLIWLALFIGLPLLGLVAVARGKLWHQRRAIAFTLIGALLGGWAWDAGIVTLGTWDYDPNNIANIWIAGLPLEEWLWIAGATLMFAAITILLEEHSRQHGTHNSSLADSSTEQHNNASSSQHDNMLL